VRERPAWVLREPAGYTVLPAPPAPSAPSPGTGTKSGSSTDPMFAPRRDVEQTLMDARPDVRPPAHEPRA